jgi:ferrous-iron efflux pump FieF
MDPLSITPEQEAKERSILFVIAIDAVLLLALFLAGTLGGSLTMLAEFIRGFLGYLLECFSFVVLRRIHRGQLVEMEFGSGKLEQIASSMIAASMLLAAGWIALNVFRIVTGERQTGTPIGLAAAAIVGIANLYVNLLAWDSLRRTVREGDSVIMDAQLTSRWVKLASSVVVGVSMTVAALSTDDVIVAWADGLGSLFVAGYLTVNGSRILRKTVPDLLDRSAGGEVRRVVMDVLSIHEGDFVDVANLRSRRAGHVAFVELTLDFEPALTLAEVDRRSETIRGEISRRLDQTDVSIVTRAAAFQPAVPSTD